MTTANKLLDEVDKMISKRSTSFGIGIFTNGNITIGRGRSQKENVGWIVEAIRKLKAPEQPAKIIKEFLARQNFKPQKSDVKLWLIYEDSYDFCGFATEEEVVKFLERAISTLKRPEYPSIWIDYLYHHPPENHMRER